MGIRDNNENLSVFIERAQQGDQSAMTALYDRFAPEIFRYAITITRDQDVAEDIASETFLRVWTSLPSYKGSAATFRAYIYTIARNYAYDVLRKSNRTTALKDEHEAFMASDETLRNAVKTERQRELIKAIPKLPDIQREVIALRFFEGLSVKEVAKIIGKSEVSVRVTQFRALRKLKKYCHE